MYLRQRYKLLTLQKVPNEVHLMVDYSNKSRTIDFMDEEELPGIPYQPTQEEYMAAKITMKDASKIAQLVTEIDVEHEKGVEALYHILSVIQDGGSTAEAVAYCVQALAPKKKVVKK